MPTNTNSRDTITALTAEIRALEERTTILKQAVRALGAPAPTATAEPVGRSEPAQPNGQDLTLVAEGILAEHGQLTSSELRRVTGCSAPEARDTIRQLRQAETIRPTRTHGEPIGGGRPPTVYVWTARARREYERGSTASRRA